MDHYSELKILVDTAGIPEMLKHNAFEIATRQADGRLMPFINATFPNDTSKAQQVAEKVFGNYGGFSIEDVRREMRRMNASMRSLSPTCKKMSVQVDQIFNAVNCVQTLSYLNTGLALANLAVTVAGFAIVSDKLNKLSLEVQRLSSRINQITSILKQDIIGKYQELTMLYNQMSAKLAANEHINLDELERLLINMKAFLSTMVMNLNEKALQEDILLEIIYTMVPAYTSLLSEFVKTYYFAKQTNSPNHTIFLGLYDELENEWFKQQIFDYYLLDKGLPSLDVVDIQNAQSLLGINGRVQVEDELDLVRMLGTKENYCNFESKIDEYVKAQVQMASAVA